MGWSQYEIDEQHSAAESTAEQRKTSRSLLIKFPAALVAIAVGGWLLDKIT